MHCKVPTQKFRGCVRKNPMMQKLSPSSLRSMTAFIVPWSATSLSRRGDIEAAAKIPKGTLGTSTGVVKNADNELSLIDFGGDPEPAAAVPSAAGASAEPAHATSGEDDLLGLSLEDKPFGQSGGIALGFGANTSKLSILMDDLADPFQIYPGLLSYLQQYNKAVQRSPSP